MTSKRKSCPPGQSVQPLGKERGTEKSSGDNNLDRNASKRLPFKGDLEVNRLVIRAGDEVNTRQHFNNAHQEQDSSDEGDGANACLYRKRRGTFLQPALREA
ncbi:unnamed protein product [Amoebophrya sp. A25]|nr:unnamed protein product [Amoebophrya sp. A25]|eukprot:GSA25T00025400001.1